MFPAGDEFCLGCGDYLQFASSPGLPGRLQACIDEAAAEGGIRHQWRVFNRARFGSTLAMWMPPSDPARTATVTKAVASKNIKQCGALSQFEQTFLVDPRTLDAEVVVICVGSYQNRYVVECSW